MPIDLAPHLERNRCAVVVFECQEFIVGPNSHLPGLAAAVRDGDVLSHIAGLIAAARSAGVQIFYCNSAKRADGLGNPQNTPLEMRLASGRTAAAAPAMGDVVDELAPRDGDVVIGREHGLTGFYASGLDSYLRNIGVSTVVLTGVSLNIGVLGTAIEAVNRGYTVVVPTDCVASDPPEYTESVLRYSLRNVALLSTAAEVTALWRGDGEAID